MKTNTYIIFIASILLLGASVASAWYVEKDILSKIETIKDYYLKEKQNKNIEFGNQLRINGEVLDQQEEAIKKVFFSSNEIVGFITELESVGKNLGLESIIEKVDYGTLEPLENKYSVQPVSFSVQLTGSYSQIKSFIGFVTRLEKTLVIKEFNIYQNGEMNTQTYAAKIIINGTILSYE
jgi:Tfp pilus assembly protein PilO